MSEHVKESLSAYLDGELRGRQLHHVEAHLDWCQICQAELQSLENLSAMLHQVPAPEFTSPERFAAQVSLRLPHQLATMSKSKIFEVGWWMVPVGLLAAWIFISTTTLVSYMVSAANNSGILGTASTWLGSGSPSEAYWSAILGQFGILSGNSLQWAEMTEAFTRTTVPQITWQVSIALLYLSWIAIWWARHTRQGHGQLLES